MCSPHITESHHTRPQENTQQPPNENMNGFLSQTNRFSLEYINESTGAILITYTFY